MSVCSVILLGFFEPCGAGCLSHTFFLLEEVQKAHGKSEFCSLREGNERILQGLIQYPSFYMYIHSLIQKKRQKTKEKEKILRSMRNGNNRIIHGLIL